jgi:methionine synthase I (cobalamin-dependent)
MILDGAMGTELIRRGYRGPTWQANLDASDLVRAIHADYVAAGAQALFTNTFLAPERDERAAFTSAIRSAKSAAGSRPVYLAIGPRRTTIDFPDPAFLGAIFDDRPDVAGIGFETCSDPSVQGAVRWVREKWPGMQTIASFTYRGDPPTTWTGQSPEEIARLAESVDVLGVNCGLEQTPGLVGQVLAAYRRSTTLPLLARPNAGSPGRTMDAESWANEVAKRSDAAMLGGCCGTTPDHIRALVRRIAI